MRIGSISPASRSILGPAEHAVAWRRRPSLEEIRAFVLDWYQCIDERAPASTLLSRLARADLELVFPNQTIRGAGAFCHWYERWSSQILTIRHEIRELQSAWDKTSGYNAECMVHQHVVQSNGKATNQLLRAHWTISSFPLRCDRSGPLCRAASKVADGSGPACF